MSRTAEALAAILLAALAAPVAAQDALIDVPVRVANVPPAVTVGSVACVAFADPEGPLNNLGYLGSGSKWFKLAEGGYTGTVTVPVKFDAAPGPARSYRCTLYFIFRHENRTLTGAAARLSDPGAPEFREGFRTAPGARQVYEVRGSFR
jgi:hypothetical protein